MNAKPNKRFPWVWYVLALVGILAFAFAPIGSVMLCAWIANAYGCKVDEGASLHHRRARLWRASLRSRRDGLVHACYYPRRGIRIHLLADCSHPSSCHLAKAISWPFPVVFSSVSAIESTGSKVCGDGTGRTRSAKRLQWRV